MNFKTDSRAAGAERLNDLLRRAIDTPGRPLFFTIPAAMPFSVRRPSGHLVTTPIDGGREVHRDTLSCCHCQRTWIHEPGSGIVRGFCTRCNGPVCGEACAKKCVPLEQMIENFEKGRELDYRPIFSAGGLPFRSGAGLILPHSAADPIAVAT